MIIVQIKKWMSRIATVLLAVALCGNIVIPAKAAAPDTRVVRIPYGYNDFLKVDQDGNVSGYYAAYLGKLAEVNNWEYEYVQTTWPTAVEMLENGGIDLLYPTNYSDEREKAMDFSAIPIGYIAAGIFALEDSGYQYGDYASFDGARIAYVKGSSNDLELMAFAQEHGFTFKSVYRNTNYAIIEALKNGQADMAVFNAASIVPNGILVSVMDAKPVYLAVREGNADLLSSLDTGMQQLLKTDLELVSDTIQKTLLGDGNGILALSGEEQAFIDSGDEVTIGFYEETEPLAYTEEDGAPSGVYIEILTYLREKSGLNLVLYPISRDQNWEDLVDAGVIDFYIGASKVIRSQNDEFRTTSSLLNYSNTLVTRNDCTFNKLNAPVIALTPGRSYWTDYLEKHLGRKVEIKYYRNVKDCMLAVVRGEVDASLFNSLEFNYHSKNDRFSSLIQWPQYRFLTDVGLTASNQVNEVMFSTVNKAIAAYISNNYVDAITDEYISMPYHSYSMMDTLYNARFLLTVVGIVVLMLGVIVVLTRKFRRRQATIQEKARERERHQLQILAALSGDYVAIYFTDLDKDNCERVQLLEGNAPVVTQQNTHSGALREYVEGRVLPEYLETLLPLCDPQEIIRRFQEKKFFSIRYQVPPSESHKEFYEMHFVDVSANDKDHKMVLGIRCVDDIVKETQKQRQIIQDALNSANLASAAKSEFLSRMSHDIRTPMNAIIGMTAIASMHVDDPVRVRSALSKISGSSRYLLGLINDVLDMSKIEAGKMTLSEENIYLPDLLNSLLSMVRPQIEEHQHKLHVRIQDIRHEDVIGDSLRIQQAFMNLMSNAIKYTPDGGEISLTVREKSVNTSVAGCFEFIFADSGIGMSREFCEYIFEPFRRAEDLRISKIQGTGLGLPITLNIVRMMNGDIKVESEPGKGSTFTMTIFLKFQEDGDLDISELAELSVLVVDDDADACDTVCAMLDNIGMKGEGYTSGQAAVDAVRRSLAGSNPFYAAILDWKMPDMDGIETAGAIRQLTGDDFPLIILSAYDWSDVEDEARAAGVQAFLRKPVFKSGIVRLFKTLWEGKNEHTDNDSEPEDMNDEKFMGRRVLLVEDNDLNREIAKEILEMAGLLVEEAENGKIGMEMFSASKGGYYDLIFMDIQMPEMNGHDATRKIRGLDREDAKSIPIVAMTANAFVEDIQMSKTAGMNDHLVKPINFDELSRVLKKYLG